MLALQFLHDFLHFHGCNLFYGWVSKLIFLSNGWCKYRTNLHTHQIKGNIFLVLAVYLAR